MNPITPTHEITLGGTVRQLRFRHRDFVTAEYLLRKRGLPVSMLGPHAKEFWELVAAYDSFSLGVLLYVGLLHENRGMTLEDAQDLITFENSTRVHEAVILAVHDALAPLERRANEQEAAEGAPLSPGANGGPADGPSDATTSDSPSESSGG